MSNSDTVNLESENQYLRRKVMKLEKSLLNAEKMQDRSSKLFQKLNTEIEFQRSALQNTKEEIEEEKDASEKAMSILSSLVNSLPDIVFYKDIEGLYLGCNKAFEEMTGKLQEDFLNMSDHAIFPKKLADSFREQDRKMLSLGKANTNEEWVVYPDGRKVFLDTVKTPFYSPAGESLGIIGVSRDITERKEAEEKMLLSRYALDKAGDSILWIDVNNGKFKYVNEKSWTTLGYTQDELIKLCVYDIDPNFSKESWKQFSSKIIKEGIANFESINTRKNGETFPIEITASYIKLGEVEHIIAFTRDISERKKKEAEFQKINMLSDNALELTMSGFWNIDFTKDNLYHQSDRATAIFGMIPTENSIYKISDWFDAVVAGDPDIAKDVDDKFNGAIAGKYPTYDATFPFKRPVDGEIVWIHALGIMERDEKGKALYMHGVTQDITESKLAEENLLIAKETSERIIDESPVPMLITNVKGVVLKANNAFLKLEKLSSYRELSKFNSVEGYADEKDRIKVINKIKAEGFIKDYELDIKLLGTGEKRTVLFSMIFVDYSGEKAMLTTYLDVTDTNNHRKELEKAKEIAEGATKAKSEFLATMSHEIRTPMNAVIGLSQLALTTNLDAKQLDYVKKINSSGHSLLGIINDILDFSKIEAGKLTFENTELDLEQVFQDHANVVTYKAHEKGLEFVLGIDKDVPLSLIGDPLRLRQVLVNLVNNAIKFTHEGEISVLAKLVKGSEEDVVVVEFSVNDTGIGIDEAKLSKLFQSFSQADASTTRKYGGSGLGLAICKGIVEGQNGEIWVKSIEGKGSSFCFTLPFTKQKSQKKDQIKPTPDVRGLNVLLCDDNATALEILENTLIDLSFKVTSVRSGADAIIALEQNIENPFDLLLLDWKMPEMDGIETIKALKNKFGENIIPAIIMVTAYNSDEIFQDAKDIDISGLLVKPVNHSTLLNAIMTAFGKMDNIKSYNKNELFNQAEKLNTIKGSNILLVEDNDINQQVARELIEAAGINVDIAENGQVAVNILKTKAHKYQLVFMDIQMPIMDGYTATSLIRDDLKLFDLPIVAMTADAVVGVKEKCLKVGMNDFITKPIDSNNLYETIKKFVKPGSFEPEIKNTPAKEIEEVIIPEFKHINVEEGLNRVNQNSELYADLLSKFVKRYVSFENELVIHGSDPLELKRYIHTLKGIVGNLGAIDLHKATVELESKYSTPEFKTMLPSYTQKLNLVLDEVGLFIKKQETLKDNMQNESSVDVKNLADISEILNDLSKLVDDNDLDAADQLKIILRENIESELKNKLIQVAEALDDFDFDKANNLLSQL